MSEIFRLTETTRAHHLGVDMNLQIFTNEGNPFDFDLRPGSQPQWNDGILIFVTNTLEVISVPSHNIAYTVTTFTEEEKSAAKVV